MGVKINIGDTWKTVSDIKINIGDAWKTAAGGWINIGDSWKKFWPTTFDINVLVVGAGG